MTHPARGTGGNRFIPADAHILELVHSIKDQLVHLHRYAEEDGKELDLGAITVDTQRSNSESISVTVSADLKDKNKTEE